MVLNELLPHETASGVVGVREEDVLVEEGFHVFLAAFVRLRTATDDENPGVVLEEFLSPGDQCFLDSGWCIGGLLTFTTFASTALLLLLFLFLFAGEHLLTFVDIYHGRLVMLGHLHHRGD